MYKSVEGKYAYITMFSAITYPYILNNIAWHWVSAKIAEDMRPPEPLAKALIMLSRVLPKAKLVPQKDLAELAIRDLKKRKQVCSYCTVQTWNEVNWLKP